MSFFIAVGVGIVVALLVAGFVDFRHRTLRDTQSGRETRRSVVSRRAEARKRGERWGTGQGG